MLDQQNTHYPKGKLPKIITHKWKQGNLLEAPSTHPMKGLFVKKFKSNEDKRTSVQLQVNCKL